MVLEAIMISQAWGHNASEQVLGTPPLYLFEPYQTEQMGWVPNVLLDISEVWELKRTAIECMEGQQHLWEYYTNVAKTRQITLGEFRAVNPADARPNTLKPCKLNSQLVWMSFYERDCCKKDCSSKPDNH